MSYTRLDQLQPGDIVSLGQGIARRQASMAGVIKGMLRQLSELVYGLPVNELEHSLQTATRALRAGAPEEMIMAALCHDIGMAISIENHDSIAAEILKPYVTHETYEMIRTHQDFQGRYYYATIGRDPAARRQYADQPWYEMACRFSDEWDQASFDPDFDTLPLAHFEPMVDRIFERVKTV